MSDALIETEHRLVRHFRSVQNILENLAPGSQIKWDTGIDPLVARLVGDSCEITSRNRGRKAFVAHLQNIRNDLSAWLGFREEWMKHISSNRSIRRFLFRSSAITIHIGTRHSQDKPQLFRAEWQGLTQARELGHEPTKGSGHPHWQVDALESFGDYESEAQALWLLLKEEAEKTIRRDFSAESLLSEEHEDMMTVRNNLGRLHFASAAAWWRNVPDNRHSHAPATPDDIESWLQGTLNYTCDELQHL